MPIGILEVITGCMSSGKSEELIRRLKRATIAKQQVLVFKPAIDIRTGASIASRDGKIFDAVTLSNLSDVNEIIRSYHAVVAFDEVQFFEDGLISVIRKLVQNGHRVLAAGLDTDFRGEPFGIVPQLLAEADMVTKLNAVCVRCGNNAIRTQRLICGAPAPYNSPRIVVGGNDLYEARCRLCHEVPR